MSMRPPVCLVGFIENHENHNTSSSGERNSEVALLCGVILQSIVSVVVILNLPVATEVLLW